MAHRVVLTKRAYRDLKQLTPAVYTRIIKRIEQLASEPRPPGVRKITDSADRYRIRIGDYRVIYQVEDDRLLILVIRVRHRREVYR
ncbi:MAG TPA: type II toxin-antitoxin system RelE/ParE family toxin [bacterium]|nr:type II toxin-antitoxin system RelE/ParE family toxin [bacterium]